MSQRTEAFIATVTQHFADIDELAQVVIKGHLLIEEQFNTILQHSVLHADQVTEANLRFYQKLQLVKAFCVSPYGDGMFDLMALMNALRNGIAHSLDQNKRAEQFKRMKIAYLRELEKEGLAKEDEVLLDHLLFMMAVGLCTGFLGRMEDEARATNNVNQRLLAARRKELTRE
ncbi:MAG: hypothetical protein ABI811_05930 [Acidobacteriota bacterium]